MKHILKCLQFLKCDHYKLKVIYLVHIIFLLDSTAPVKPATYSKTLCEWILRKNKKKALNRAQVRRHHKLSNNTHKAQL